MYKKWLCDFFSFFKKKDVPKKIEEKKHVTRHAQQRMEQRKGDVLTDEMVKCFIQDINNGKAKFVKNSEKNKTSIWIVYYKDKRYKIVYDSEKEVIITVLTRIKKKRSKPSRKKDGGHPGKKMVYKRKKRVEYEKVV